MRRSNTEKIGDVIKLYINALDLDGKLKEIRLIDSWPEVVGIQVANKTKNLVIKNRVLFVYLTSPIVKAELAKLKKGLIDALNRKAGTDLIDEIVLR